VNTCNGHCNNINHFYKKHCELPGFFTFSPKSFFRKYITDKKQKIGFYLAHFSVKFQTERPN
jgi:hypothetical protein